MYYSVTNELNTSPDCMVQIFKGLSTLFLSSLLQENDLREVFHMLRPLKLQRNCGSKVSVEKRQIVYRFSCCQASVLDKSIP